MPVRQPSFTRPGPPRFSRRRLLAAAAGSSAFALPGISLAQSSVVDVEPPTHTLTAAAGQAPLFAPDFAQTDVWAYEGTVPGPVLRVRKDAELSVRLVNRLDQPTTVHWHGVRIQNDMDGVANLTQAPVAAGASFDYRFRVPDAGTYWYHPHFRSYEQLARGLYGVLIVEEDQPPQVDRDLALVFDDWRADDSGNIHEQSFGAMMDWSHAGRLGNVLTVNGLSYPEIPVRSGERLRLRLLNTANARVMPLQIPNHPVYLVALDGQPVAPRELSEGKIVLAPGQRADVFVDMSNAPGTETSVLMSHREGEVQAALLAYSDEPPLRPEPLPAPEALPANGIAAPQRDAQALDVELRMQGGAMGRMASARFKGREMGMRELVAQGMVWALNGTAGRPEQPLLDVQRGRTVVVRMVNEGRWPHAMHFHGHHVTVVERNGNPVEGTEWRDTVMLEGEDVVSVAFVADNPGKWMLHCHMLEHQAAGMGTWFRVQA